MAPPLAMALALGIEVSGWTVSQQIMQRSADMAALAGAEAYNSGTSAQLAANAAAYVAELNGATGAASRTWVSPVLTDGTIQVTVTTTSPATIAVKISKTVSYQFASYVLTGAGQALSASATAALVTPRFCILALDPSTTAIGVAINNGATIDTTACGVKIDTGGSSALTVIGATLDAANLSIDGTYTTSNGGVVTATTLTTGATTVANPYAGVSVPTAATCNAVNGYNNVTTTISPTTFCNGLWIGNTGTAHVTMNAGVYIINGGNFFIGGGSSLTATTGVTIVLTGSPASATGIASIGNGATLNIVAPVPPAATAGIAIFQNPSAPSTGIDALYGGATMTVTGALLFASQMVQFSNGVTNTSGCTQLIAYQIQFVGGAKFGDNCVGTGTLGIGVTRPVKLTQ